MENYINHSEDNALLRLTGKIRSYKQERLAASFIFTDSDQTKMGVLAVASAAAGLPGQAAILSNYAAALEEEADYVQFNLGDKTVKGWLWRSPFGEGDDVIAAVEERGSEYELYGLMRPEDKVIALYPHCSRGRTRHVRAVVKWWLILT